MEYGLLMSFFVAMIAIMNPLGSLAIFAGLVADKPPSEQKSIAKSTAFATCVILLLITWAGPYILDFFGISVAAFETAGALIIILLGLSMMSGHSEKSHNEMHHTESEHQDALEKESISVVPLAIPIIAGPGAISTIIVRSHHLSGFVNHLILSALCVILALIILVSLYYAGTIKNLIGQGGIKIATRVMGLVLTAIAFDMLGSGLSGMFPGLAA